MFNRNATSVHKIQSLFCLYLTRVVSYGRLAWHLLGAGCKGVVVALGNLITITDYKIGRRLLTDIKVRRVASLWNFFGPVEVIF